MDNQEFPKKINNCPIIEAIVEVRFKTVVPRDAVFGIIYSAFQQEFPKAVPLPVLQLPDQIRSSDPQLADKAHYVLENDDITIQIGPQVFAIINKKAYNGWDCFKKQIEIYITRLKELSIIDGDFTRLGLRYINLFEGTDIFKESTIEYQIRSVEAPERQYRQISQNYETTSPKGHARIVISHPVSTNTGLQGSILDIDSVVESELSSFASFSEALEYAHDEEKHHFFKLLGDDLISKLQPEY